MRRKEETVEKERPCQRPERGHLQSSLACQERGQSVRPSGHTARQRPPDGRSIAHAGIHPKTQLSCILYLHQSLPHLAFALFGSISTRLFDPSASIPSPSGICSLGSINPYTRLFDPCCMSVCQNLPCCSGAYSKLTPLHGRENGRKHPYKRIEMCMFKPRVFYTLHFLAHEILSLCIVSSLR